MPTLANATARWVGTWQNERGSVLRIRTVTQVIIPGGSQTPHFRISGTYQTAKGAIPFSEYCPVTGYAILDQIGFTVSFHYVFGEEDVKSLTSWAGQILPVPDNPNQQRLQTLWHLVPNLAEGDTEDEYGWVIAWAGEDRFRKLSNDPDFDIPVEADGSVSIVNETVAIPSYADAVRAQHE